MRAPVCICPHFYADLKRCVPDGYTVAAIGCWTEEREDGTHLLVEDGQTITIEFIRRFRGALDFDIDDSDLDADDSTSDGDGSDSSSEADEGMSPRDSPGTGRAQTSVDIGAGDSGGGSSDRSAGCARDEQWRVRTPAKVPASHIVFGSLVKLVFCLHCVQCDLTAAMQVSRSAGLASRAAVGADCSVDRADMWSVSFAEPPSCTRTSHHTPVPPTKQDSFRVERTSFSLGRPRGVPTPCRNKLPALRIDRQTEGSAISLADSESHIRDTAGPTLLEEAVRYDDAAFLETRILLEAIAEHLEDMRAQSKATFANAGRKVLSLQDLLPPSPFQVAALGLRDGMGRTDGGRQIGLMQICGFT